MSRTLAPKLEILPRPQRLLWTDLKLVPPTFVLYGGTAIALRLGHRASVDFDFFSSEPFDIGQLTRAIPWLAHAEPLQSAPNTYTATVDRNGPVKVSFFGGLSLGRAGTPDRTIDDVIYLASLVDLAATKLAVIQQRAESRDYRDLEAILCEGIPLREALAAARALYRERFNPMISLKALSYFKDGDLPTLSSATQDYLANAAAGIRDIPDVTRVSDRISVTDCSHSSGS
jgi:hypothetical protein